MQWITLYLFIFRWLASTDGMEGFKALLVLFVAGIFIVGIDSGKNSVYSCTWPGKYPSGLQKAQIFIYNAACKDNYPKNYWKR